MRVVYLYQSDWPRNTTRIAKQTKALADAGHEVLAVDTVRGVMGQHEEELLRQEGVRPAPPTADELRGLDEGLVTRDGALLALTPKGRAEAEAGLGTPLEEL